MGSLSAKNASKKLSRLGTFKVYVLFINGVYTVQYTFLSKIMGIVKDPASIVFLLFCGSRLFACIAYSRGMGCLSQYQRQQLKQGLLFLLVRYGDKQKQY